MTNVFASASGLAAAPLSAAPNGVHPAPCVAEAAQRLLPHLQRGQRIDAAALRAARDAAFGGSDSEGAWDWKTAYDACEAATVLFRAPGSSCLYRIPNIKSRSYRLVEPPPT